MGKIYIKTASYVLVFVILFLSLSFINADNMTAGAASSGGPYLRVINRRLSPGHLRLAGQKVLFDPRPKVDQENVPCRTSFYFVIDPDNKSDTIYTDSIKVQLTPEGGNSFTIMEGEKYAEGYSGSTKVVDGILHVCIDTTASLLPSTKYTIKVTAESANGGYIADENGTWSFTTQSAENYKKLNFSLDISEDPVTFKGRINGLVIPAFNTATWAQSMFEIINETREEYPNAWTHYRDFFLTGFGTNAMQASLQPQPNIVRELETRRVVEIKEVPEGIELKVEDFFGHEQYGIPSGRPLSDDYHPGDIIQIGDNKQHVNTKVIKVNDSSNTVVVEPYDDENLEDWSLEYDQEPPKEPNPKYPGLFVTGGTHLRKFSPAGTPVYYWERLDHQFDALVSNGFKPMPNFVDAPQDVSIDGQPGNTAKDLMEMRQVAYDITDHIIKRYGADTVNWHWSIFNEINYSNNWKCGDYDELQRFYDYTVDGILKAFEDNNLDSNLVKVGGVEMGGTIGVSWTPMDILLTHASPTAEADNALSYNAVYTDPALDGKRSRRIQELGDKYGGKGSPMDFVAYHTYHNSKNAAFVMNEAKRYALEIDSEYFAELEVCNHESVPLWRDFYDVNGAELFLGNGYFSSWAADFMTGMIVQAAEDSRYQYVGNILITLWPWHAANFGPMNDVFHEFKVRANTELLPAQIYHFINLFSTMGPEYWIIPGVDIEEHYISGIASQTDDELKVLLYSHNIKDTQARSDREFEITLDISGYDEKHFTVIEYKLDKDHNSFYNYARQLKGVKNFTNLQFERIKEASELRPTNITEVELKESENPTITVKLSGNCVSFLKIIPVGEEPTEPTPGDTEPTPSDTEPTPGITEPTPGDTEPTPNITEPTPGDSDPMDNPTPTPVDTPTETPDKEEPKGSDDDGSSPGTGDVTPVMFLLVLCAISFIGLVIFRKKAGLNS